MVKRDKITKSIDKYLKIPQFKDYCPIGLQVEGADEVKKMVTGVSVSLVLLKGAVKRRAQMVMVHHGLFWKDQSPVLKGAQKRRVAYLLENNLSLIAYHLPLDAHPVVGNNAQIIKTLGAKVKESFGEYHGVFLGFLGAFDPPLGIKKIMERLKPLTRGAPLYFPGCSSEIKRFGVVSGGAGSLFQEAIDKELDLYITGEGWEPAKALSLETGVGFMALGHHNSEKLGVLSLGNWVKRRFKIETEFMDVPNPV